MESKDTTNYKKVSLYLIVAVVILLLLYAKNYSANQAPSDLDKAYDAVKVEQQQTPQAEASQPTTEVEREDSIKEIIHNKLKDKAKRDWPNDYTTQEYWINQQLEAYEQMKQIPNDAIKRQAQRDWPLDFSTQLYWYNQQIEAKERLK